MERSTRESSIRSKLSVIESDSPKVTDLSKQNSFKAKQDSISSKQNSVKGRADSVKRRVEIFNEERKKYANEKDDDYAERRKRKKLEKQRIQNDRKLRLYKRLYWPAFILMFLGCIFTFGATVKSLGEGSFLWTERQTFWIVGPVCITAGLVFLMVAVAFVTNQTNYIKQQREKEDLERREEKQKRIREYYIKRRSIRQEKALQRKTLGRSISGMSASTCHSIDELESSDQFVPGTTYNILNGYLCPGKRQLIKKDSSESSASSRLLDCSLNSTSTLMTSLSSNITFSLSPFNAKKTNHCNGEVHLLSEPPIEDENIKTDVESIALQIRETTSQCEENDNKLNTVTDINESYHNIV